MSDPAAARAAVAASLRQKGRRLAAALKLRGWLQAEFAERIGFAGAPLSRSLVAMWVGGYCAPSPEARIAIKRVLKFDPWVLTELDPAGVAPHVAAEAAQEIAS